MGVLKEVLSLKEGRAAKRAASELVEVLKCVLSLKEGSGRLPRVSRRGVLRASRL